MERKDDIWLKQWKDCLEDFEEEVPVDGWEKLQTELPADETVAKKINIQGTETDNKALDSVTERPSDEVPSKIIPFQRWKVGAAAAAVALIGGAGIWFLTTDKIPQVPSIESPVAQVAQTEIPDSQQPMAIPENQQEESQTDQTTVEDAKTIEDEQSTAAKSAVTTPKAVSPAVKVSEPVLTTPAKQTTVSVQSKAASNNQPVTSSNIVAKANISDAAAEEGQRQGSRIEVKEVSRNQQAQRSLNPVIKSEKASTEVGTVNKRQVRVSTDERMHNVSRFRKGDVTTRSMGEITDMDRVYNSFSAHYDELYNKIERLFDNGTGAYSTVDNALFLAGLVKKMQNQRSAADEQLFREIASRFIELQQPNGLWKDSLLDPTSHNVDIDTDSYICYALAWGLNNGLLSRKQYLDAVRHAWRSIGDCNSEPCLMAAEQVEKLQ